MTPTTSFKSRIPSAWILAAAGCALFSVYLFSAYPALSPYRDSGDMAAGAITLGVAHPPGYPFYLLLSHLWLTLLPLGSAAFRLNILSAAAGAAAACLGAYVVWRALKEEHVFAAAAAFLLLGLAPACWHLSLVSEMYSLNALVGIGILALMLPEEDSLAHRRRIYAGALLFGLGLGNHQTLVAALPGYVWIARGELFNGQGAFSRRFWRRRVPALAFFALLGFALYAYLPVRSAADPLLDWGEPETLRNFFRMLTRADYGGVRLHPERPAGMSPAQWMPGLLYTARLMGGELGWVGLLLFGWGVICGRRQGWVQGSLAAFFASGPLFILWANLDPSEAETYAIIEPHLVLPIVFASVIAGCGVKDLCMRVSRVKTGPLVLAFVLLAGWSAEHARGAGVRMAYRKDFSAWDYGKALHAALSRNALLLDPDDPTAFTLSYMALGHNMRPDILTLMYFRTWWGYRQLKQRHPELLPTWKIRSGQELLGTLVTRSLEAGRNLFVDLPQKTPVGTMSYPMGIVYRVLPRPPEIDERLSLYYQAERARHTLRMRPAPSGADFFTRHTMEYWSSSLNNLAIEAGQMGWPDKSMTLYRRALTVTPGLAESWNNLGNAHLQMRNFTGAEGAYRLSLRYKNKPAVIYNLGRVYFLDGRYSDAEREFKRAIEDGGPREAQNDLGLVYLRTERIEQAALLWRNMIDEDPYYVLAYYNVGLAYEKLGRLEEAAKAVSAYGQLVADPREKQAAFAWLKRLKK